MRERLQLLVIGFLLLVLSVSCWAQGWTDQDYLERLRHLENCRTEPDFYREFRALYRQALVEQRADVTLLLSRAYFVHRPIEHLDLGNVTHITYRFVEHPWDCLPAAPVSRAQESAPRDLLFDILVCRRLVDRLEEPVTAHRRLAQIYSTLGELELAKYHQARADFFHRQLAESQLLKHFEVP